MFAAWYFCDTASKGRVSRAIMQLTTHPSPSTPSSFVFTVSSSSVLVHALRFSTSSGVVSLMNLRTSL